MIGDFPFNPDWSHPALEAYDGIKLLRDLPFDEVAIRAGSGLVYLATPYSKLAVDDDGKFKLHRSNVAQAFATSWARRFARAGVTAVAPISLAGDMIFQDRVHRDGPMLDPLDGEFWEYWCRPLLSAAHSVVIPPIEGWSESVGVWREAIAALGSMKSVYLVGEVANG